MLKPSALFTCYLLLAVSLAFGEDKKDAAKEPLDEQDKIILLIECIQASKLIDANGQVMDLSDERLLARAIRYMFEKPTARDFIKTLGKDEEFKRLSLVCN